MNVKIVDRKEKISRIFKFYLSFFSLTIRWITTLFRFLKIPGLSRFLFLFSYLPTKGSLKTLEFVDGGKFSFPIFDYYYNMFFLRERDYEPELLDLCNRINLEYVFFDGGANLGYISSSFIHLSDFCKSVVSIEPNDSLFDILEYNIVSSLKSSNKKNFQYFILNKAISKSSLKNQFFKIGRHAGSSLAVNEISIDKGIYMDTISLNELVEVYSLNSLCVFKLDLEGNEFEALSTFKFFHKSIIIIEVLDFQLQEVQIKNLCEANNLMSFVYLDKWVNLELLKNNLDFGKKRLSNLGLNLLLIPKSLKGNVNV
jgi:FkbM family methyltransferase